jgi:hypothetical protein
MAAHLFDHFVFTARRLSERTKTIVFVLVACAVVANFWWFRGVAWGIDGPINNHWGLQWRKVRPSKIFFVGLGVYEGLTYFFILFYFFGCQSWNIYELR